jgi:hypothetical protein
VVSRNKIRSYYDEMPRWKQDHLACSPYQLPSSQSILPCFLERYWSNPVSGDASICIYWLPKILSWTTFRSNHLASISNFSYGVSRANMQILDFGHLDKCMIHINLGPAIWSLHESWLRPSLSIAMNSKILELGIAAFLLGKPRTLYWSTTVGTTSAAVLLGSWGGANKREWIKN